MASKNVKKALKSVGKAVAKTALNSLVEPVIPYSAAKKVSNGSTAKKVAEKAKTPSFNERASEASTIRNTLGRKSTAPKVAFTATSTPIKKASGGSSTNKGLVGGPRKAGGGKLVKKVTGAVNSSSLTNKAGSKVTRKIY